MALGSSLISCTVCHMHHYLVPHYAACGMQLAGVYVADVRDEKALADAAARVAAALPAGQGLDVLLNNAGVGGLVRGLRV